jgi:Uma2 family endonuclease
VVCRPNSQADSFQDAPVVLVEVLSRATRRIDNGEKKDAYLAVPSLDVYVLIEQEIPALVAFRRQGSAFARQVYQGLEAVLPLPEIGIDLPLAEIYEAVQFDPEPDRED